MPRDPRVDAYIASKADFARPILEHLREAVHAACPEVEETIKWSMPSFTCKGRILAHMAAFKAHASFGFWQGKEVVGDTGAEGDAMGQFGRIASIRPTTSRPRWPPSRRRRRPSMPFRPAAGANISNGSQRRKGRKRARSGSRRRSNGWPKARNGTGNTRPAEPARRRPFCRREDYL